MSLLEIGSLYAYMCMFIMGAVNIVSGFQRKRITLRTSVKPVTFPMR